MSGGHFVRVFCILHVIFVLTIIGYAEAKYKLKLVSLEKCKIPASEQYKNAPVEYSMNARKVNRQTTLVQANFSITASVGPVYFSVRGYQVKQSSSKDLMLNLEKMPCNNPVIATFVKKFDIKLDKNCFTKPGNFSVDDVNIQDFGVILTRAMVGPGKYSYELEIGTPKGVAICIYVICDISIQK